MIYYLEGPDCTGKSTFARKLQSETSLPINWCNHLTDLELALDRMPSNTILDRFVVSEFVYGTVFRNSQFKVSIDQMVSEFKSRFEIKPLLFLPKDKQKYLNFFASNLQDRDELYHTQDKVYDMYKHILDNNIYFEWTQVDIFEVNYGL